MDRIVMRQVYTMRSKYPQFTHFRSKEGNLVFTGTLQPQKNMPISTVFIEYRGKNSPRVWVAEPKLVDNTPHRYPDGNICLFKPTDFDWTAGRPIADFIIPWTSSWLYFYEVWKTKHIWLGPEASHDNTLKNE
jgi:hypothetical protein